MKLGRSFAMRKSLSFQHNDVFSWPDVSLLIQPGAFEFGLRKECAMTLLVLDDELTLREAIKVVLGGEHRLLLAPTISIAQSYLETEEIDGALIDVNLQDPQITGLDFLNSFKKKYPDKPAIMISGAREIPTVVRCMKLGADDYIEKPFDADTLRMKVSKVLVEAKRKRVYQRAFEKVESESEIIGNNAKLLQAKALVEEAAGLRVLFYGETGVGKTPFARFSNQVFSRLTGEMRPFEQINCAALNTEQFQDQLFGHKKGAFTGAIADKRGLVELAKGGDLFLDEIGEMPLETQALFLTFLDSMEYYRLGDDVKRKADVRIIAATNRDLKKMVEEGKFRKDLYSRISQIVVNIPAMRDRMDDLRVLFEHFVCRFAGHQKPYDADVLEMLAMRTWEDGNVRELQDAVEYLCLKSRGSDRIEVAHLGVRYLPTDQSVAVFSNTTGNVPIGSTLQSPAALGGATPPVVNYDRVLKDGLETYLDGLERGILQECLTRYQGTLDEMARDLKVSRPTLYRRLKHHQISSVRDSREGLIN
jgi:DNA-binding NtrC family response regulator